MTIKLLTTIVYFGKTLGKCRTELRKKNYSSHTLINTNTQIEFPELGLKQKSVNQLVEQKMKKSSII